MLEVLKLFPLQTPSQGFFLVIKKNHQGRADFADQSVRSLISMWLHKFYLLKNKCLWWEVNWAPFVPGEAVSDRHNTLTPWGKWLLVPQIVRWWNFTELQSNTQIHKSRQTKRKLWYLTDADPKYRTIFKSKISYALSPPWRYWN